MPHDDLITTSVGITNLINAENNGTNNIVITNILLGTGNTTPTASITSLVNQTHTVPANTVLNTEDNFISVQGRITPTNLVQWREIGLEARVGATGSPFLLSYLSHSSGDVIATAAANNEVLFAVVGNFGTRSSTIQLSSTAANLNDLVGFPSNFEDGRILVSTTNSLVFRDNTFVDLTDTPISIESNRYVVGSSDGNSLTFTDLPRSNTTTPGLIEIATQVEVSGRTDNTRAVTPFRLPRFATQDQANDRTSTDTIITPSTLPRFATQQEINARISTDTIVTPATLPQQLTLPLGTTDVAGILRTATEEEVEAETSENIALTPANIAIINRPPRITVFGQTTSETNWLLLSEVRWMRVRISGGGGGGGAESSQTTLPENGDNSSFRGDVIFTRMEASGGQKGINSNFGNGSPKHGDATGGHINIRGGGSPGGVGATDGNNDPGIGGANGGYCERIIINTRYNISNTSFRYVVGEGGRTSTGPINGENGVDGYLIIEEYF